MQINHHVGLLLATNDCLPGVVTVQSIDRPLLEPPVRLVIHDRGQHVLQLRWNRQVPIQRLPNPIAHRVRVVSTVIRDLLQVLLDGCAERIFVIVNRTGIPGELRG